MALTLTIVGLLLVGYYIGRRSRDAEVSELKQSILRLKAREYGQNRVWKAKT